MRVISDEKFPIKIWATDLEKEAEMQSRNLANMPFIHKHVALMADAHAGKGSTVGTVIATKGAIIPAAVGVDMGCGMRAVKLSFKIDVFGDSIAKLRSSIERAVPVGFNSNKELTQRTSIWANSLKEKYPTDYELNPKCFLQLGTLGGGNHFIEICHDQNNEAWIVLHSGSRNIGKTLAEKHIKIAQKLMDNYFIELADRDLAFLPEKNQEFSNYIQDLMWSQDFAFWNRQEMMHRVLDQVYFFLNNKRNISGHKTELSIDCHHNYTQKENHFGANVWITRKGAVSAKEGEWGIIPGSMGTETFIVKGKGNVDSFGSCSHGAGRRMSRKKANALFTLEDAKKQTTGVECKKDESIIDELPGAYKNINEVMANQSDLVEIVYTLKQIMCVKG